jgi:hypothetical protein
LHQLGALSLVLLLVKKKSIKSNQSALAKREMNWTNHSSPAAVPSPATHTALKGLCTGAEKNFRRRISRPGEEPHNNNKQTNSRS